MAITACNRRVLNGVDSNILYVEKTPILYGSFLCKLISILYGSFLCTTTYGSFLCT